MRQLLGRMACRGDPPSFPESFRFAMRDRAYCTYVLGGPQLSWLHAPGLSHHPILPAFCINTPSGSCGKINVTDGCATLYMLELLRSSRYSTGVLFKLLDHPLKSRVSSFPTILRSKRY